MPEGLEFLGRGACPGMLQRGLKRRSCLTGLASVRDCAAYQVAVGSVCVCFNLGPSPAF